MSKYDGVKNPAWTDEEYEFWQEHMELYFDDWWRGSNPVCGHALKEPKPDMARGGDFVVTCVLGHETVFPVLRGVAANLDEGSLLR